MPCATSPSARATPPPSRARCCARRSGIRSNGRGSTSADVRAAAVPGGDGGGGGRAPRGRRPPSRAAMVAGAIGLAAFAVIAYTPAMAHVAWSLSPVTSPAPADAIVVLGAGAAPDGTLSDQSLRRLVGGLVLFRRGLAPRVIL